MTSSMGIILAAKALNERVGVEKIWITIKRNVCLGKMTTYLFLVTEIRGSFDREGSVFDNFNNKIDQCEIKERG